MTDAVDWYRAEHKTYAHYDPFEEFDQRGSATEKVEIRHYRLLSLTPKGAWLETRDGKRWCSRTAINGFARPTELEALNDLKCRKERQVSIYSARIKAAEKILHKIEGMMEGMDE